MIKKTLKEKEYIIDTKKMVLIIMSLIIIITTIVVNMNMNFDTTTTDPSNITTTFEVVETVNVINDKHIALLEQEKEKNSIDEYLREYASYYNLDGDKIVEFARDITGDYEISLNEVGGPVTSDNKEAQAMLFVYYLNRDQLSNSLSSYGLSKSYFAGEYKKTTLGEGQTLNSGLTFSQFLGKVCDNLGMPKEYLLAISYLETGKNTSSLARYSNNFGGLRGSGSYLSYDTPEMGIIAFIMTLKGYEKYNLTSIYELSGIYTHGNKYNPSQTWVNSVNKYHSEIVNNIENYFLVEDL